MQVPVFIGLGWPCSPLYSLHSCPFRSGLGGKYRAAIYGFIERCFNMKVFRVF